MPAQAAINARCLQNPADVTAATDGDRPRVVLRLRRCGRAVPSRGCHAMGTSTGADSNIRAGIS